MGVLQRGCKWPNLLFRLEAIVDMKGQNPFVWYRFFPTSFDIPGLVSVDMGEPQQV